MTVKSFLTVAMLSFLIASPALAEKGGNGKSRPAPHEDKVAAAITTGDRAALRGYLAEDYKTHCPPGLAKKNPACIPPGQNKPRYAIGQALPADILLVPVPADLRGRMKPLPAGYAYIQVDRDVLLISEVSRKVIDAVTLLSAVGN